MSSRIDQKTPSAVIQAGDFIYSLRGNQDLSLDAYAAINALAQTIADTLIPAGTEAPFAGISVPSGWLEEDGSAVSKTTYATLWNALHSNKGAFTVTIATPGVFTLTSHGLLARQRIYLTSTGSLPTGLAVDTNYYIIFVDANTFRLATTLANAKAGTAINTTGSQSGVHSLVYAPWGISGSSNFLLPDSRSGSKRGRGTPTQFTSNTVVVQGEVIDDSVQGHRHTLRQLLGGGGTGNQFTFASSNNTTLSSSSEGNIGDPSTDGVNGTPRTGLETTGKSVGTMWMIKT